MLQGRSLYAPLTHEGGRPSRRRGLGEVLTGRVWLAVVVGLCLLPTLAPGDVPWINDEPKIILNALRLNEAHGFAHVGLQGTREFYYGPLPTWLYQAFLAVSHDLRLSVLLRVVITMLGCAAGLTWLARGLRVSRWLVPVSLASPHLWLYARSLWDNTFLIPLAALSIGAYVAFLTDRRTGLLLCAVGSALLMTLVHLMSLAVAVPLALHAFIFARRDVWRARYKIVAIFVVWSMIGQKYLIWLFTNRFAAKPIPSLEAASFPIIGGRWLSAIGLDLFFQESWGDVVSNAVWLDLARLLTVILIPAVWVGIALAVFELSSGDRRQGLIFILMVVAAQMALDGISGVLGHSHYFNGTWPAFAALSWLTLDRLLGFRWTRWLPGLVGASLVVVTAAIIVGVHRLGGTRGDGYGPTLSNQMEIARELNQHKSPSLVDTDVRNFLSFPHGIAVLRLLDDRSPAPARPAASLMIRYVGGQSSGRVALIRR